MSRVASATADLSPPRGSSSSQSLPAAPLSPPSVTASARRPSRPAIVETQFWPRLRAVSSTPTLLTPE